MLFKCLISVILLYNLLISTAHASTDKSSFILNPIFEIHQLANWAMTYYAQTHLKSSNSLQPFHYWMVGMNLAFMLLYFAQYHLIPGSIFNTGVDLNMGISSFSIWILTAMSNRGGFLFGYFIPFSQNIAEVAEMCLPYYFSFVVLLNFWFKPLNSVFFVKIVLELIFITHSCLVQTSVQKNKYWNLLLELTLLTYYFLENVTNSYKLDLSLLNLIIVPVFVISLAYGFPFLTRVTKLVIIMITLIGLAGCLYFRIDALLLFLCKYYIPTFLILLGSEIRDVSGYFLQHVMYY